MVRIRVGHRDQHGEKDSEREHQKRDDEDRADPDAARHDRDVDIDEAFASHHAAPTGSAA
ncbi:hypothetical protein A5780_33505 [Nocardia sp. 852002-20019_SCH5090214]|nr:hypothetical protein A5780_33505 [Nocardia sp. 852002-20019_SCH5090214]